MGIVGESAVSPSFVGDTLRPDELTRLLGIEPDQANPKCGTILMPNGRTRIAPTGAWSRGDEGMILPPETSRCWRTVT